MLLPPFLSHRTNKQELNVPQLPVPKLDTLLLQNRRTIPRAIHQIGKMILQRLLIASFAYVLQNLNDNIRVAVAVEVDFLVVGDFSDLAVWRG